MKYAAITSMDKKYYDHCGRAMLNTYKTYWSDIMPIYVYNEDNFKIKVKTVESMGWDLGTEYEKFQNRHQNDKVKIFAKKAFSIIHAMKNIECDRLVWLDADTIIQGRIPTQLLDLISPDNTLSTHFSVWHEFNNITFHSCETGFFILNKKHSSFNEFANTYENIYCNDLNTDLRRFYDGEVYGKTVEILESQGNTMLNLNPKKYKTPISRSVIAPYLTHFKAGVKDTVDFSKYITNE